MLGIGLGLKEFLSATKSIGLNTRLNQYGTCVAYVISQHLRHVFKFSCHQKLSLFLSPSDKPRFLLPSRRTNLKKRHGPGGDRATLIITVLRVNVLTLSNIL